MGKGFRCTDLIKDRDLGTIFKDAFKREVLYLYPLHSQRPLTCNNSMSTSVLKPS